MAPVRIVSLVVRIAAALVLAVSGAAAGQSSAAAADPLASAVANAARTAQPAEQPAPLVYANREIVQFRATVLSRSPAARAVGAAMLIERVSRDAVGARVTTSAYNDAVVVKIGEQVAFVVFLADVDPLQGESLATKAAQAAAHLQVAMDEAAEFRNAPRLLRAAAVALAATLLFVAGLWLVVRIDRRIAGRLGRSAERNLLRLPGGEVLARATDTRTTVERFFALVTFVVGAILTYAWLTVVLRRFPYTRPWGESLRGGLLSMAAAAGGAVMQALPNIFAVVALVALTRLLVRVASLVFVAVEEGRLTVPWLHPDTAQPTRRIVVALLWLCAVIASYPYLPGSNSEAFKGVSVFVGLVVSLGSTGIMNQLMSGLMVTYSRALKVGDFVRVGEIEGTVTAIGTLATKVRTARNEELTVPNAIMVSNATTNYSRNRAEGVLTPTSVTIGYDAPWRQVQALLLLAAQRTPGVRAEPKPVVLQVALEDFYVKYTLLVALEQPHRRYVALNTLHANIQDTFNEYGVQIMSPHYEADPAGAKVVPPQKWYAAPAAAVPASRGVADEVVRG